MAFTNEQLERYSRHIILQEVGVKGQKKLLNAKVLIIGAGGLGAPAALYLAAAGVGTIGIVDAFAYTEYRYRSKNPPKPAYLLSELSLQNQHY